MMDGWWVDRGWMMDGWWMDGGWMGMDGGRGLMRAGAVNGMERR